MNDKPAVTENSPVVAEVLPEVTMSTPARAWPSFRVGETIVWKGVTFYIQRVNKSNIVLRPDVEGMPAAQVMWLIGLSGGR